MRPPFHPGVDLVLFILVFWETQTLRRLPKHFLDEGSFRVRPTKRREELRQSGLSRRTSSAGIRIDGAEPMVVPDGGSSSPPQNLS